MVLADREGQVVLVVLVEMAVLDSVVAQAMVQTEARVVLVGPVARAVLALLVQALILQKRGAERLWQRMALLQFQVILLLFL